MIALKKEKKIPIVRFFRIKNNLLFLRKIEKILKKMVSILRFPVKRCKAPSIIVRHYRISTSLIPSNFIHKVVRKGS